MHYRIYLRTITDGDIALYVDVASKHAVLGLSRTASEEYGPKNIRVYAF